MTLCYSFKLRQLKIVCKRSPFISSQISCIINNQRKQQKMFPYSCYGNAIQQFNTVPTQPLSFVQNFDFLQQMDAQLRIMVQTEGCLAQQLQDLREQLQKAKGAMFQSVTAAIKQQFEKQLQGIKKMSEQKNILKKDQLCPAKSCTRKYSSKIALRAHIRKSHAQDCLTEEEFKA